MEEKDGMKTCGVFIGVFFCFLGGVICFFLGYLRTGAYTVEDPLFGMVSMVFFSMGIGLSLLFCVDKNE